MLCTLKLAFLAIVAGFVIQAIGFACPGWFIMEIRTTEVNMALWYAIVCTDTSSGSYYYQDTDRKCFTMSYHKMYNMPGVEAGVTTGIKDIGYSQLVEWEVLATIALALALLALFLVRKVYRNFQENFSSGPVLQKKVATGAFLCSLLSGVLMFVPVGTLARTINSLNQLRSIWETHFNIGVPYGLIITGFGAGLALVTSLLLLWAITRRQETPGQIVTAQGPQMVPLVNIQATGGQNQPSYDPNVKYYPQSQPQQYPQQYPGQGQGQGMQPAAGLPPSYYDSQAQDVPLKQAF